MDWTQDMILVSPAEPKPLWALGQSSSLPEKFGADFLWSHNGAFIGVQRKAYSDLLASLHDGRLQRELAQMQRLAIAVLVIEGKQQWSVDGELLTIYGTQKWNRHQHRNLVHSVQSHGVWVACTENMRETVAEIRDLYGWVEKGKHQSLIRRPGPVSVWGKAGNEDYALHVLQGFQGVGPDLAKKIIEHFKGLPLHWSVTAEQLQEIDGVGPKRANALIGALA